MIKYNKGEIIMEDKIIDNYKNISFVINSTKLSPKKNNEIIEPKHIIESQLLYYNVKNILYEDPEGTK